MYENEIFVTGQKRLIIVGGENLYPWIRNNKYNDFLLKVGMLLLELKIKGLKWKNYYLSGSIWWKDRSNR